MELLLNMWRTKHLKFVLLFNKNGLTISFVKTQTLNPIDCRQSNGIALRLVNEQTPELRIAAVMQNGWALESSKNKRLKFVLLQSNKWSCSEIRENPTRLVLLLTNCLALKYVKKQTTEICLAAVA